MLAKRRCRVASFCSNICSLCKASCHTNRMGQVLQILQSDRTVSWLSQLSFISSVYNNSPIVLTGLLSDKLQCDSLTGQLVQVSHLQVLGQLEQFLRVHTGSVCSNLNIHMLIINICAVHTKLQCKQICERNALILQDTSI